ncbi:MAG: hypothetical protein J6N81_06510 [Treponema sp.]|nr:hypothetical protein [Treponema sp.]
MRVGLSASTFVVVLVSLPLPLHSYAHFVRFGTPDGGATIPCAGGEFENIS